MARPLCLFTGQWADLSLEELGALAASMGYEGLELACWGDHFDVQRALAEADYCEKHWALLGSKGLGSYAISSHLVGQAVADRVDERHQSILSEAIWGGYVSSGTVDIVGFVMVIVILLFRPQGLFSLNAQRA